MNIHEDWTRFYYAQLIINVFFPHTEIYRVPEGPKRVSQHGSHGIELTITFHFYKLVPTRVLLEY